MLKQCSQQQDDINILSTLIMVSTHKELIKLHKEYMAGTSLEELYTYRENHEI